MSKKKETTGRRWPLTPILLILAVVIVIYLLGGIGIGVGLGPGKGPGNGPGPASNNSPTKEPSMQPASINSHPLALRAEDFQDLAAMVYKIRDGKGPVAEYIREQLSEESKKLLGKYDGYVSDILRKALLTDLNYILRDKKFYQAERFAGVQLSEETKRLLNESGDGDEIIGRNRALIEDSYPKDMVANYKFEFRHDRIFYLEEEIKREQFRELLNKAAKQKKQGREVYHKFLFDKTSTTNKFFREVQEQVESSGFKFNYE